MRKLSGLIAIAILFANATHAQERCEDNGGFSYWNGNTNQWQCKGASQSMTKLETALTDCWAGNYNQCNEVGVMYYNGDGVEKDFYKAFEFTIKACDEGNNPIGCYNLGYLYANGHGVKADQEKSVEYVRKACNMKDERACNTIQQLDQRRNEQVRKQREEQLYRQRQQQEQSENIQTVTNGLNGITNQLNQMNNQMQRRNNSYQGFDASKGLNFKGYGY